MEGIILYIPIIDETFITMSFTQTSTGLLTKSYSVFTQTLILPIPPAMFIKIDPNKYSTSPQA